MPPRLVTGQIFQQVHPHIFVLRTDESQPQQKGAEGERRVIPDGRFPELRVLLVDALRRDRHSQNDVCFGFTRMERGIEQAPFDCTVIEYRMHIARIMLSSTSRLLCAEKSYAENLLEQTLLRDCSPEISA